ncbi:hypothetical protein [Pseudobutyrivibrio sp. ACV-2]|nr:hypothetical protein [Pseudobutyrivibrio sp. ACV-2]
MLVDILVNPIVSEAGSILPAGGDTNYILHFYIHGGAFMGGYSSELEI